MSATHWSPDGDNLVVHGDNLAVVAGLPDAAFTLIYLDPPFNTGRAQHRQSTTSVRSATGSVTGFQGQRYERIRGDLMSYDDRQGEDRIPHPEAGGHPAQNRSGF